MAKADITISAIMLILVALISITLLLGLFGTKLPSFARDLYCKTIFIVHSSTFVPQSIRQDESYCNKQNLLCKHSAESEVFTISRFNSSTTVVLNFTDSHNITLSLNISGLQLLGGSLKLSSLEPSENLTVKGLASLAELNEQNSPFTVDLYPAINRTMRQCTQDSNNCTLNITFDADSGNAVLHDIAIQHRACAVEKTVLAEMLACWMRAYYGSAPKGFGCCLVEIPASCALPAAITEASITELLNATPGACDVLPNNDYGCGGSNKIEMQKNITSAGSDVLIEFKNKMIVVS